MSAMPVPRKNPRPMEIKGPHLLLAEGADEKEFLAALLKYIDIHDVQVEEMGGKDQFPGLFATLMATQKLAMSQLQTYAIIRDAEGNADDTFKSLCHHLRAAVQPFPAVPGQYTARKPAPGPRVGIFLMPDNGSPGMLEDLCLKAVQDHPAMPCVREYIACLRTALPPRSNPELPIKPGERFFPKNVAKAEVQTYLAAMHDNVIRLGHGAARQYFNFGSPVYDELKRFLEVLR